MEKIKRLIEILEKVKPGGKKEMGLIIIKDKKDFESVISQFEEKKPKEVKLNQDYSSDDLIKIIIKVFKEKKWLLVFLADDLIGGRLYKILQIIQHSNRLQISDLTGLINEEIEIKQPGESRIVFVSTDEILTRLAKKGFNQFINLFGVGGHVGGGGARFAAVPVQPSPL